MKNPIDDLTYDWITILHSKAKGMNAYEKYIRDAKEANAQECVDMLEDLRQQDSESVRRVLDHVTSFLQSRGGESRRESEQQQFEATH